MSVTSDETTHDFDCPCCGKKITFISQSYYGRIRHVSVTESLIPLIHEKARTSEDGVGLEICGSCNQPCCPSCDNLAGEGLIVCTRCTTYPDCGHKSE